jgi:hypothetical protein
MVRVKTITINNNSGCRLRFTDIGQKRHLINCAVAGHMCDVCDVTSLCDRAKCFSVEIATG